MRRTGNRLAEAGACSRSMWTAVKQRWLFCRRFRWLPFAESLGGTESLITYPIVQTHPDVPQEMKDHLGITDSLKFDFAVERNQPADVFPLWVADMDFRAADPIREGLQRTLDHGIIGYTESKQDYLDAVTGWF